MAKITLAKPKLSSDELDRMLSIDTTKSVSLDTSVSSTFVSMDTNSSGESVSKDTPLTELIVSKDTISDDAPVSKDTISDDAPVSKDTKTAVNAVSKDTNRVAYRRDFRKKRYKTVSLDMLPDEVKRFKECANAHGLSMTEFFRSAANAYIVSLDTSE